MNTTNENTASSSCDLKTMMIPSNCQHDCSSNALLLPQQQHRINHHSSSPLHRTKSFGGHEIIEEEMIFPMSDITVEDQRNRQKQQPSLNLLHQSCSKVNNNNEENDCKKKIDKNNNKIVKSLLSKAQFCDTIRLLKNNDNSIQISSGPIPIVVTSTIQSNNDDRHSMKKISSSSCHSSSNSPAISCKSFDEKSLTANGGVGVPVKNSNDNKLKNHLEKSLEQSIEIKKSAEKIQTTTKLISSSVSPLPKRMMIIDTGLSTTSHQSICQYHPHHHHDGTSGVAANSPMMVHQQQPTLSANSNNNSLHHHHDRVLHQKQQRSRSNSGPIHPLSSITTSSGFTQQVRHSALISAGMATRGMSLRRQSDQINDQQHHFHHHLHHPHHQSMSRSHRTSPNRSTSGGGLFDSFRPRSTSDSKGSSLKRPSVIATWKNNLLNRHSSTLAGATATASMVSSSSSSNSSSMSLSLNNSNNVNHHHQVNAISQTRNNINQGDSGFLSLQSGQPSPNIVQQQSHNRYFSNPQNVINDQSSSRVPNYPHHRSLAGTVSAPISPNGGNSVLDPFSLDYSMFVSGMGTCVCNENAVASSSAASTALPKQSSSSYALDFSNHRHQNRPRSRSGSASSTMARVFEMFRGRSNSIATEQPQYCYKHGLACRTFSNQDATICDRLVEFEDIDENLVYVRFFKFYRCYDIIPVSAKLVVFDTQLAVKKAFFALLSNGIRAAPLWDSQKHRFIGLLTVTDFIFILRTFYQSSRLKIEELEEHTVDNWRNMLKEKARPLVWIEPDESLFNAIKMLLHNKVHRLPVIDRDTGNVLYILTHKRILKFLFLFYYNRLPMPSYLTKQLRDLPQIGTYENIITVTHQTPLIEALTLLLEKRVSALPIVDKKNKVIDIYAKFDVIHLAVDKMYQDLDVTLKKALEYRNQFERIVKCTMNETLHTILERIVQAEVHRIIVVDNDDHVIGIISLSDLLTFLVLRPVNQNQQQNPDFLSSSNSFCPVKTLFEESVNDDELNSAVTSSSSVAVDSICDGLEKLKNNNDNQTGRKSSNNSLNEDNQLTVSSIASSNDTTDDEYKSDNLLSSVPTTNTSSSAQQQSSLVA